MAAASAPATAQNLTNTRSWSPNNNLTMSYGSGLGCRPNVTAATGTVGGSSLTLSMTNDTPGTASVSATVQLMIPGANNDYRHTMTFAVSGQQLFEPGSARADSQGRIPSDTARSTKTIVINRCVITSPRSIFGPR